MTSAVYETNLEANLTSLREQDPDFADSIRQASASDVEVIEGPRGQSSVSENGVLLASAYDPAREGARLAMDMADQPVDILIAVGFGLGHHLAAFRARNPCPVVVYEPRPARLRAALRASPDLTWLGDDDVHLTDDPDRLREILSSYYVPGHCIKIYPHPSLLRLDPGAVQEAIDRVARVKESADLASATRQVKMQDWASTTVSNARHLVGNPSTADLAGSFHHRPAVVCAAGPSLGKQLSLLARYRDRILVIAIGQSLGSLRQAGIEPDLVIVTESQNVAHQLTEAGDLSEIDLVLPPQAHSSLFDLPVGRHWIAFQNTNPFGCWVASQLGQERFTPSAGTVVQCGIHLADELGCDRILLIGQDLAFTGGRLYAEGSAYSEVGFRETPNGEYEYTNLRGKLEALERDNVDEVIGGRLVWVRDWDGKSIPTNESYASFIDHYRDLGPSLAARNVQIVNCTEGGAYITGIDHMNFEEALEALPAIPLKARATLEGCHDAFLPPSSRAFEVGFSRLRRDLRAIRKFCAAALAKAQTAHDQLKAGAGREDQVDLLRDLSRTQKKLARRIGRVTLLDAVVQRELHYAGALMHKAAAADPSPAEVVGECGRLMEATRIGLDRAAELTVQLEEELARHD